MNPKSPQTDAATIETVRAISAAPHLIEAAVDDDIAFYPLVILALDGALYHLSLAQAQALAGALGLAAGVAASLAAVAMHLHEQGDATPDVREVVDVLGGETRAVIEAAGAAELDAETEAETTEGEGERRDENRETLNE